MSKQYRIYIHFCQDNPSGKREVVSENVHGFGNQSAGAVMILPL
jgi:hypothetical protein